MKQTLCFSKVYLRTVEWVDQHVRSCTYDIHFVDRTCNAFSIIYSNFTDFKTNYRCDYNWLNRGYQKNVLKPLEPRSIYDAVKSLGHTHLLDVVPQPSISPSVSDRTSENEGVTSRLCVISWCTLIYDMQPELFTGEGHVWTKPLHAEAPHKEL